MRSQMMNEEIGNDVNEDWKRHIALANHRSPHPGKNAIFPIHRNDEKMLKHVLGLKPKFKILYATSQASW